MIGLMERNAIVCGDALGVMRGWPDGCVQMCVTSPPYWGLRDYGLPPAVWGGDEGCEHEWSGDIVTDKRGLQTSPSGTLAGPQRADARKATGGAFCSLCGAWSGCLGLEPTPELYVEHLTEIMREVRRVLRDDGTCWINLGDSYNGSGGAGGDYNAGGLKDGQPRYPGRNVGTLKPKDLVGIPWRVAFALQADGWWLRSDVIWAKPNPMPESVTDRPTRAHEYVFLLSKSKRYYYDADAVREPNSPTTGKWGKSVPSKTAQAQGDGRHGATGFLGGEIGHDETIDRYYTQGRNRRTCWTVDDTLAEFLRFAAGQGVDIDDLVEAFIAGQAEQKNVWTIATKPFGMEMCQQCKTVYVAKEYRRLVEHVENRDGKEIRGRICQACGSWDEWVSHFAVFPPALIEPCILAGTSARGCCPECGAGWERVVERKQLAERDDTGRTHGLDHQRRSSPGAPPERGWQVERNTTGWQPTCDCFSDDPAQTAWDVQMGLEEYDPIRCVVLDPFMGAGTTALVALEHNRDYVGIELNPDYIEIAEERLAQMNGVQLPFPMP